MFDNFNMELIKSLEEETIKIERINIIEQQY